MNKSVHDFTIGDHVVYPAHGVHQAGNVGEVKPRVMVDGDSGDLRDRLHQQARAALLDRIPERLSAGPRHVDNEVARDRYGSAALAVGVGVEKHDHVAGGQLGDLLR